MVYSFSKKGILTFIMILLLTVVSNDSFLFGSNSNELMVAIPRYGLLFFAVFMAIKLIVERKIIVYEIAIVLLMAILLVFSCLLNHVGASLTVIKIAILFAGFFFCTYCAFIKWSYYFRMVMYFLSICSIIMTLCAYIIPSVIRMLPVATNISGVKMYVGFFSGILDVTMGSIFIRSPGVFWEPGVYQIYLNLAILLTLYSDQKKKKKYLFVYLVALLFTFSTTGFIAAAWIIITFILFSKSKKRSMTKNIVYFVILSLVFLAGLALSETHFFDFVFGKLSNRADGSYIARLAGFVINYEIAVDHPIFGFGPDMAKMADEFVIRSSMSTIVLGWTKHNTNTLMYQFAAFGIPYGTIYSIGTFLYGRQIAKNVMSIISIFGAFVLLYTGENLFSSILPYIIIFYGIKTIGQKMKKTNANKLFKYIITCLGGIK